MKVRHLLKIILSTLIMMGVLLASPSFAVTTPKLKQSKAPTLPKKDIQRFVTAIAIIRHYYINDVDHKKLFNGAIEGMVTALDPHSTFLSEDDLKQLRSTVTGRFVGIGVELTLKNKMLEVISPLDNSPAKKAGIQAHDLIIKVGEKLVNSMSLREAISHIKGRPGTNVSLTILRKGVKKPLRITLKRSVIKLVSIKSKLLENHFGYVRITLFQGQLEKQLKAAIRALKKSSKQPLRGLVLDLRNNPGGLLDLSAQVADSFLDLNKIQHQYDGKIVYTKGRIKGSNINFKAHPGDIIDGIPLIVLINGGSASASEIVAGALQDHKRALIMGTRSFGKGSVQTILTLSKSAAIKLTTALYYTPSGHVIQAEGITPDITVPKFTVQIPKQNGLRIEEDDYSNHLQNGSSHKLTDVEKKAQEAIIKYESELAQKDYQLYEALLMLKGLDATR